MIGQQTRPFVMETGLMKISNRFMLLGGIVGVIMTAVPQVFAESGPSGGHGKMWQAADSNQDGSLDRAEFDAMRDSRFAAMDENGDNALSAAEFKAARDKRREDANARTGERREDRGARMLAEVDTSKDGRITANEWQANALQRFVRLDTNGDGAITEEEMSARRAKHHDGDKGTDGKRLKMGHDSFMGRLDSDGDGQVSRVEWNGAGDAMFGQLDANGDGLIAMSEIPQHRKMHQEKTKDAPVQP
jgi:Ca2+-binding EF-hand superfamily protein